MRPALVLVLAVLASPAAASAPPVLDLDRLIPALIAVESGGNDRAVGDSGKAKGALQIWDVVIKDVNRVYGTRYVHDDAFDRTHAVTICKKYLAIYCTERRLGRAPTLEDAARMWNGGPNGHKKSVTLPYWEKVARRLFK